MNSTTGIHAPAIPHRREHQIPSLAAVLSRHYGIPGSPLFHRKLRKKHSAVAGHSSPVNFRQGFRKGDLSARKLAAGLWQLRFMEVSGDGGAGSRDGSFRSSKSELANGNIRIGFPSRQNYGDNIGTTKDMLWRPLTILRSRNGIQCELESAAPCLKCSKEEATKWDPPLSEKSSKLTHINSSKLFEDKKRIGDSLVTALLAELLHAQRCINKLKSARKSSKKKVQQFLHKLEEEKVSWKCRERQKIQALLDDLQDKLRKERRDRKNMELLNSKLAHELAESNLSAKKHMKNYEEEKRGRELMEEVCNELVKKIGEDEAKLEELQNQSIRIREQVEEERTMLQMAELWREKRVQMKLVDAKNALEDKYSQIIQLIAYLQTFLRSRGAQLDTMDMKKAEWLKEAAESINIQSIMELSYDFSKSEDIFSIYEELRKEEADEKVIKPCLHPSPTIPSSTIHIVSLDEDNLSRKSEVHQSSSSSDYNTGLEVTNTQQIVCYLDNKDSSYPHQRRDTSTQDKNILGYKPEGRRNAEMKSSETGITEVCSRSARKRKAASASKLRSCPSNGMISSVAMTCHHKSSGNGGSDRCPDSVGQPNLTDFMFDECKRRLSSSSVQSVGITSSPSKGSCEDGFRCWESVGQRNSTDAMNPHITRGMKGCIEWPRGVPRTNLKAIPLEARIRHQKSQLQHILKPKA